MSEFIHQRHKGPIELERPRELVLACPPLRSNVNLSRIVRLAGCCGVTRMIVCGNASVDRKIARDALETVAIEQRRTLPPVLKKFRDDGYQVVGLEQATRSESLHTFQFVRRTLFVVGHERTGLTDELLSLIDRIVEIPVYGRPLSYNVATATAMALYEYCKQFPTG